MGQYECDDGNRKSGDGCNKDCGRETGFLCRMNEALRDVCVDIVPPWASLEVQKRNELVITFSELVHTRTSRTDL